MLTAFGAGIYSTFTRPRSNAREVAFLLQRNMGVADLLIIVPDWYAPAVNHYLVKRVDQIDYPGTGRVDLIDFSDVWLRMADTVALSYVRQQVLNAHSLGRSVWLVSGPRHLHRIAQSEIAEAYQFRKAGLMATLRANQIQDALDASYGSRHTSLMIPGPQSRYNQVVVELYSADH